jgi:hypothetical protein
MDFKQIADEVLPVVSELMFPTMLIGERELDLYDDLIYPDFRRFKKKKQPKCNILELVEVRPKEEYLKYMDYFEKSKFNYEQLNYIFNHLDKVHERYSSELPIKNQITIDVNNEEYDDVLERAKFIKDVLINSYELAKNEVLSNVYNKNKLTNPVIQEFCLLIHHSNIMVWDDFQGDVTFCKAVCEKYKLKYSDNVRQSLNHVTYEPSRKGKYLRLVCKNIFPLIPQRDRETITDYLYDKGIKL